MKLKILRLLGECIKYPIDVHRYQSQPRRRRHLRMLVKAGYLVEDKPAQHSSRWIGYKITVAGLGAYDRYLLTRYSDQ